MNKTQRDILRGRIYTIRGIYNSVKDQIPEDMNGLFDTIILLMDELDKKDEEIAALRKSKPNSTRLIP